MRSLEILRTMGPDNYKKNSLNLAKEILKVLSDFAPKLVSEYEKESEKYPSKKYSNNKCIIQITGVMEKLDGKEASDTHGEPIKFDHTGQFREPFSLRVDLIFGKKERGWFFSGTDQLVNIEYYLWSAIGAGLKSTNGALNKKQTTMLRLIETKQSIEQDYYEYRNGKEVLKEYGIDLENIELMKFYQKLDQANNEHWESRKTLCNLGIDLGDRREKKQILQAESEVQIQVLKIKEKARIAKFYFEQRKKSLENIGIDPEKFDLWGNQVKQ